MIKLLKGNRKGYKGFVGDDGEIYIISLIYNRSRNDKNHLHARVTESCFIENIQLFRTGKYVESVFGYTAIGKPYTYKAGTHINGEKIYFFPAMYSRRKGYDFGKECAVSFAKDTKIRREEAKRIVESIAGEIKPPTEK